MFVYFVSVTELRKKWLKETPKKYVIFLVFNLYRRQLYSRRDQLQLIFFFANYFTFVLHDSSQ